MRNKLAAAIIVCVLVAQTITIVVQARALERLHRREGYWAGIVDAMSDRLIEATDRELRRALADALAPIEQE